MTKEKSPGLYKKLPFSVGTGQGVTLPGQGNKKIVGVKHNLPGSIILVHGVNDVGTSYDAVESGLCEGLTTRLRGDVRPATYRMPQTADTEKLEEDPDAVFYKRQITDNTHSPVIPFYWGFREETGNAGDWRKTPHGQAVDRYGNRLDRDYAKGGGPFGNATTSLPEMWNRGKSDAHGALDWVQRDATRPIRKNPGRLYMILAARRLAALISMIRDYDEDETVSIVAHSQGCMLSLLAQAFLLDPKMQEIQPGARPADTLILCNPPYSLVDELPTLAGWVDGYSGEDAQMKKDDRYRYIRGGQTLHARLTTLANIVKGVVGNKHESPPLAELTDAHKHCGTVGPKWVASTDRDNRGKVYLYFSPEDMTVALSSVQGIGWQGVPDYQRGHRLETKQVSAGAPFKDFVPPHSKTAEVPNPTIRKPLSELGAGFFQRVFTLKRRPDPQNGRFVMVGEAPHDFALRVPGEDDHAHTADSDTFASNHGVRAHLPGPGDAPSDASPEEQARFILRRITGEALPKPIVARMAEGAFPDAQHRYGASEHVDQIDAAIAVTSDYGIDKHWECIGDSGSVWMALRDYEPISSPRPALYEGKVAKVNDQRFALAERLNRGKENADKCEIKNVYVCLDGGYKPRPVNPPKLLIERTETPNEARKRWQKTDVPRSFHSAVYGGRKNHSHVTAYDVAIGGGHAPTHPLFYKYLCAVADWRLKQPGPREQPRPGILTREKFLQQFSVYWADERPWRKALIEGNSGYYSKGILPDGLPLPPELPTALVVEPMSKPVGNSERVTS
ncbi:T6SS effector phospholipase Tle3 domain-containing protein [Massilia horti]|uniref:DUF3274 domain-containing protein n=1 Tax=Massilia horti TaxID=2562153 RepID=A0A4Y9T584_9BURK|nr:DUF3274 domain-containing protein [Massilia horti]TFW33583.1 DUF3274 domain-containing protein [Massilia horti]